MNGTCKDCKWWGAVAEGICSNEKVVFWMSTMFYGMDRNDPEDRLDGVETAPNYSCRNFEQKVESTQ